MDTYTGLRAVFSSLWLLPKQLHNIVVECVVDMGPLPKMLEDWIWPGRNMFNGRPEAIWQLLKRLVIEEHPAYIVPSPDHLELIKGLLVRTAEIDPAKFPKENQKSLNEYFIRFMEIARSKNDGESEHNIAKMIVELLESKVAQGSQLVLYRLLEVFLKHRDPVQQYKTLIQGDRTGYILSDEFAFSVLVYTLLEVGDGRGALEVEPIDPAWRENLLPYLLPIARNNIQNEEYFQVLYPIRDLLPLKSGEEHLTEEQALEALEAYVLKLQRACHRKLLTNQRTSQDPPYKYDPEPQLHEVVLSEESLKSEEEEEGEGVAPSLKSTYDPFEDFVAQTIENESLSEFDRYLIATSCFAVESTPPTFFEVTMEFLPKPDALPTQPQERSKAEAVSIPTFADILNQPLLLEITALDKPFTSTKMESVEPTAVPTFDEIAKVEARETVREKSRKKKKFVRSLPRRQTPPSFFEVTRENIPEKSTANGYHVNGKQSRSKPVESLLQREEVSRVPSFQDVVRSTDIPRAPPPIPTFDEVRSLADSWQHVFSRHEMSQ